MYRPQADTWLLVSAYLDTGLATTARSVLDVCTGTGAVAMAAADAAGASCRVTAVDATRRAVWAARWNSLRRHRGVAVRRGNLFAPVDGHRYDVVLANPPYVPAPEADLPRHGPGRSWDAGRDGRLLLDRLCRAAPRVLTPGGSLLVVHSSLCGIAETLRLLAAAGLHATVAARKREPFGPVMSSRAAYLEERGLIAPGCREEELVVVRADRS
ncbi:HemK2/MTQ2 family protein methyltransferase [Uniformispora flossi]|uniref:HemK2/MTQ2 family protein methyltransferase n=1 Tax=Uniformispora flossi TaxID=3390723 RepID=UPI003C2AF7A2